METSAQSTPTSSGPAPPRSLASTRESDSILWKAGSAKELTVEYSCRVDLKELKTYQQLYLYFVPMFTNLGFVNIIVVVVRLFWFRRKLKNAGSSHVLLPIVWTVRLTIKCKAPILLQRNRRLHHDSKDDLELGSKILPTETPEQRPVPTRTMTDNAPVAVDQLPRIEARSHTEPAPEHGHLSQSEMSETEPAIEEEKVLEKVDSGARITFDPSTNLHPKRDTALYIPGPRDRDKGKSA
jgi:hypothetical protein